MSEPKRLHPKALGCERCYWKLVEERLDFCLPENIARNQFAIDSANSLLSHIAWQDGEIARLEVELQAAGEHEVALREAIIWMSGADVFAAGGEAGKGYDRVVRPVLATPPSVYAQRAQTAGGREVALLKSEEAWAALPQDSEAYDLSDRDLLAVADAGARKVVEWLLAVGGEDAVAVSYGLPGSFIIPMKDWQALRTAVRLDKEKLIGSS